MPTSELSYKSVDGTKIVAYRWDPEGPPRAAVQLTHGMGEHARRYDHVARALNDAGFVVYAQDHRGHGASADPGMHGNLGQGGWAALVGDIGLLSAKIRADHLDLPLILLGHSMGSFAVQQYLFDHSADADGVVLTGTAAIDLLEDALDLDQPIDLAMFNAPFQPARTDYDWLSRDEAIVDAYVAGGGCDSGWNRSSGSSGGGRGCRSQIGVRKNSRRSAARRSGAGFAGVATVAAAVELRSTRAGRSHERTLLANGRMDRSVVKTATAVGTADRSRGIRDRRRSAQVV